MNWTHLIAAVIGAAICWLVLFLWDRRWSIREKVKEIFAHACAYTMWAAINTILRPWKDQLILRLQNRRFDDILENIREDIRHTVNGSVPDTWADRAIKSLEEQLSEFEQKHRAFLCGDLDFPPLLNLRWHSPDGGMSIRMQHPDAWEYHPCCGEKFRPADPPGPEVLFPNLFPLLAKGDKEEDEDENEIEVSAPDDDDDQDDSCDFEEACDDCDCDD